MCGELRSPMQKIKAPIFPRYQERARSIGGDSYTAAGKCRTAEDGRHSTGHSGSKVRQGVRRGCDTPYLLGWLASSHDACHESRVFLISFFFSIFLRAIDVLEAVDRQKTRFSVIVGALSKYLSSITLQFSFSTFLSLNISLCSDFFDCLH